MLRRIDAKQDFPPEALADAALIIRSFVEDYHEKLEEDFLFPRFEKANLLVDLVKVLPTQHQAGRQVTDVTMRFAHLQSLKNELERVRPPLAINERKRSGVYGARTRNLRRDRAAL